jgi:hypothetical protein
VVKALLDAGADINAKDAQGQNALFYAVRRNSKDMVQFLLDHGINYYAPDNDGMIARTLAFNLGHKDLMDQMDKFVVAQTDKVNEQYKEYNRQLEERNKQIEEQNKTAMEDAERQAKEQPPAAAPATPAAPTDAKTDYLDTLAPKESIDAVIKRQTPAFEADMRSFAFQNCAFQYWSFCRQVKQRTDLSAEELRVAIDTHREQVLELGKKVTADYKLEPSYVDNVGKSAMQRINDDLDSMPSKTYRFEQGVCMMPDLSTRCTDVAETWAQLPEDKKPANATGNPMPSQPKGGIGGVSGGHGMDGNGISVGNKSRKF